MSNSAKDTPSSNWTWKQTLLLIAGDFDAYEIPKEKAYLFKYFRTNIERQFLKYYFVFGGYENFSEHTGVYCQKRWLKLIVQRITRLEQIRSAAKSSFDESALKTLTDLEKGKIRPF